MQIASRCVRHEIKTWFLRYVDNFTKRSFKNENTLRYSTYISGENKMKCLNMLRFWIGYLFALFRGATLCGRVRFLPRGGRARAGLAQQTNPCDTS